MSRKMCKRRSYGSSSGVGGATAVVFAIDSLLGALDAGPLMESNMARMPETRSSTLLRSVIRDWSCLMGSWSSTRLGRDLRCYFAPPAAERMGLSLVSPKFSDLLETNSRTSLRLKRQLRPIRFPGITPLSASLYTVLRCIFNKAATSEGVMISSIRAFLLCVSCRDLLWCCWLSTPCANTEILAAYVG